MKDVEDMMKVIRHNAVSYTHLDVYKRQGRKYTKQNREIIQVLRVPSEANTGRRRSKRGYAVRLWEKVILGPRGIM